MSDVVIETDRLIIRDVTMPDGEAFIHMASDGSLNDVANQKLERVVWFLMESVRCF